MHIMDLNILEFVQKLKSRIDTTKEIASSVTMHSITVFTKIVFNNWKVLANYYKKRFSIAVPTTSYEPTLVWILSVTYFIEFLYNLGIENILGNTRSSEEHFILNFCNKS